MSRFIILSFILILSFSVKAQSLELAHTYFKQGEYDKAAEVYKKLSEDKKFKQLIHHDYLATLLRLKNFQEAEKFVKSQIQAFPSYTMYKLDYTEVLENMGKKEEADKELEKLINEAGGSDFKVVEAINFLNRTKNFEMLVKLILRDREVTKNPFKFDTWLASAYNQLNQKEKMIEEILGYGQRVGNMDYVKSIIQDNFVTEAEQKFIETLLFEKIQKDANETFLSEILIWWYAQKKDFARAFIQARALDKRMEQNGFKIFDLAGQSYASKDFKNATRMYEYLMNEYPKGDLYPYARTLMIKSKEEVVKDSFPVDTADIFSLIKEYESLVSEMGPSIKTAEAMRNTALLQAFYLDDYDSSIKTLERAIAATNDSPTFRDQSKIDLGDIYLLKGEPWESTLLYLQVEKSQRESTLGETAKFKNAKLQYYTGQFSLAKDLLDVLKKATSKEVSNDAIELSLLIDDNTGLDTSEVALRRFAEVDLLLYQNRFAESLNQLDILYKEYSEHPLADEILMQRANTKLRLNKINEAVEDLKIIIEKHADDILADDALFLLAKVTEENLNDKEKAMQLYRQILTDFPASIFSAQARIRFRELRGDNL